MTTPNTTPAASPASGAPAVKPPTTPSAATPAASPSGGGDPVPADKGPASGAPPAAPAGNEAKAARAILEAQAAKAKANAEKAALEQERARVVADAKAREEAFAADFKKDPLAALKKHGVTYEDLTKAQIAQISASTPQAQIDALRGEIAAKEEAAKKEREAAAKAAADAELARTTQEKIDAYVSGIHAEAVKEGSAFPLVAALDKDYAQSLVFDVADLMATESKTLPTAEDVLGRIEAWLESETEKLIPVLQKKRGKAADPTAPAEGDNPEVTKLVEARNARRAPAALTNKVAQAPTPKDDTPKKKMSRNEALAHVARLAAEGKLQ